jgi:4-hydroxybenzoate polyprenyltransferase
VFAPLVFTPSAWQLSTVVTVALGAGCFCLWSSSIYCVNDVLDSNADAQHPRKRARPIPSGRLSIALALGLSAFLAGAASLAAGLLIPGWFLLFGLLYLGNALAYCLYIKHRVIADVLCIATGFVLRLLGGCAAIAAAPSSWLVVCGFSLAMLLGFGKRRLEVSGLDRPDRYRPALQSYDAPKLNGLLSITASLCLISYMLYTVAPQTVATHNTDQLVYTVPFVIYGVFRYLFKVQEAGSDGPVDVLLKDPIFALNGALWLVAVLWILSRFPPFLGGSL